MSTPTGDGIHSTSWKCNINCNFTVEKILKLSANNVVVVVVVVIIIIIIISYSQAYYKNFNAIIEEPEKTPDRLTTGITYLILKSGDSKEVRNY